MTVITVTGIETACRFHKRACDRCGYMKEVLVDGRPGLDAGVTMEASVTFQRDWGRFWKITVWTGDCECCGAIHRGEMVQVMGVKR